MQIADLITPARVQRPTDIVSRKRALEQLANMLAPATPDRTAGEILDALRARERLGSTAVGAGYAIPRARLHGLDTPVGAFIQLATGIDYGTGDPDTTRVDQIFALLFPENAADEAGGFVDVLTIRLTHDGVTNRLHAAYDEHALSDTLCALDGPA